VSVAGFFPKTALKPFSVSLLPGRLMSREHLQWSSVRYLRRK